MPKQQNFITNALKNSTGLGFPLLIFLTALLVRIAYLLQSRDNPTFLVPIVDMNRHHLAATAALAGGSTDPIFQAGRPYFYPSFLSIVYYFSDSSVVLAKILQCIVGSMTCLLTFTLGTRVFGRSAGILAGLIACFYGPMIFWEAELVASGWGAFWAVALLSLLIRKTGEHNYKILFLTGLTGAFAIITRPAFLLFFLAASLWLVFALVRFHKAWIPVIQRGAVLLAGFLLVAVPVLFLSYRATGQAKLMPSSGGLNAYIGNNKDVCKTLAIRPGPDFDQLLYWPVSEGYTTTPERSQFFYGKVREFMTAEPLLFLRGLARKAGQYLNGTETPRTVDIYVFRQWSSLLRTLVWRMGTFGFPWGVVFPLAILGLIFRWRQIPTPIILLVTLYPVLHILIFMAGRYRIPVIPAMAILAAAGCFSIVETFRQKTWMHAAAVCCLAVFIAFAVNVHDFSCQQKQSYEAEMYCILGHHYMELNNLRASNDFLEKALQLERDSGVANRLYGLLLMHQSQFDRALSYFNKSLEVNSADYVALYRRGVAYRGKSDFDHAKSDFAGVLAIAPYYSQANLRLGEVLYELGEYEAARKNWQEAAAKGGPVAAQASKYLQTMSKSW